MVVALKRSMPASLRSRGETIGSTARLAAGGRFLATRGTEVIGTFARRADAMVAVWERDVRVRVAAHVAAMLAA